MDEFLKSFAQLPALMLQIEATLSATQKALTLATEQLSNARLYEADAADYLGVEKKTMYHYRRAGLAYEKVGNVVSYRRSDLDAWRQAGKTRNVSVS